ncbi:hypothetical protein EV178_004230 [Coemansia sp. RSA 1646]|nr:hypothetical protein EV178_004230 [Coemansia sp. RSA 1646]
MELRRESRGGREGDWGALRVPVGMAGLLLIGVAGRDVSAGLAVRLEDKGSAVSGRLGTSDPQAIFSALSTIPSGVLDTGTRSPCSRARM